MGFYMSLGFYPIDGYNCPKGVHNAIPEFLRPYVPTFNKTYSPLFSFYEFSRPDILPLGIKLFPDRYLLSKKRKVYNAITKFDITELEKLLDKEDENSKIFKDIILDDFQMTAFGIASSIGNVEAVHYLLLKGVDINAKFGDHGKTGLHLAVETNQELLVKFLLLNGADMTICDNYGFGVYQKAENRGIYNMKKIFDNFMEKKNADPGKSSYDNLINLRKKKKLTFEELKCFKNIIVEDVLSPTLENFKPSNLLEIASSNIASKNFSIYDTNENFKDNEDVINLETFNLYTINIPSYDRVNKDTFDENGFKLNNKLLRYDDLIFAKI